MLKIGLTGTIGSGKSTISGIFSLLGVPVYRADDVSKAFLEDEKVKSALLDFFGAAVFDGTGRVNRPALAAIVFTDSDKLNFLNGLLHPLVREHFRNWAFGHSGQPYLIHEAAILFESGFAGEFDRIIHVSCPEDLCIARVVKREGVTPEQVLARMRHQWSDAEKAARADFIILNDNSRLVIPQVIEIHEKLTR